MKVTSNSATAVLPPIQSVTLELTPREFLAVCRAVGHVTPSDARIKLSAEADATRGFDPNISTLPGIYRVLDQELRNIRDRLPVML